MPPTWWKSTMTWRRSMTSMNSSSACAATCKIISSLEQAKSHVRLRRPRPPHHHVAFFRLTESGQFLLRYQHTISVGVDPVARIDRHASDLHAHIALAHTFFIASLRMRSQRPHTDVTGVDFIRIADATIDNDAGPAIVLRQQAQLADDQ